MDLENLLKGMLTDEGREKLKLMVAGKYVQTDSVNPFRNRGFLLAQAGDEFMNHNIRREAHRAYWGALKEFDKGGFFQEVYKLSSRLVEKSGFEGYLKIRDTYKALLELTGEKITPENS